MARHDDRPPRHTATEWSRLVRAWKRSGLNATKFAASVGVAPRTLIWWRWRLAQGRKERAAGLADVRLVQLDVEAPEVASDGEPRWEISTAGGTLRVRHSLAADEARSIVEAFLGAAAKS